MRQYSQDRVNHDHSGGCLATCSSRRGQFLAGSNRSRGVANLDVRPDDPQAERASQGRDDGRVTSSPNVNKRSVEDDGCDSLDQTVNTGVQGNIGDAERAEKCGRVVVNGFERQCPA